MYLNDYTTIQCSYRSAYVFRQADLTSSPSLIGDSDPIYIIADGPALGSNCADVQAIRIYPKALLRVDRKISGR